MEPILGTTAIQQSWKWRYKSSGILCHFDWYTVTNTSEQYTAYFFSVKQPSWTAQLWRWRHYAPLKCQQLPFDMAKHSRILWIFIKQTVRASTLPMMNVLASSKQQMVHGITNFYSVRGKECERQAKMSGLDTVRYGCQHMPAPFL